MFTFLAFLLLWFADSRTDQIPRIVYRCEKKTRQIGHCGGSSCLSISIVHFSPHLSALSLPFTFTLSLSAFNDLYFYSEFPSFHPLKHLLLILCTVYSLDWGLNTTTGSFILRPMSLSLMWVETAEGQGRLRTAVHVQSAWREVLHGRKRLLLLTWKVNAWVSGWAAILRACLAADSRELSPYTAKETEQIQLKTLALVT